jgi:hypothetical protein
MGLSPSKLSLSDYFDGVRSFSTGGFYLLLLIVGAVLLLIVDEQAEEAGVGNSSRVAGSASAQLVGESSAIAHGAGAPGRHRTAPESEPIVDTKRPEPTSIDNGRPVQSLAESTSGQRDVRKPAVSTDK